MRALDEAETSMTRPQYPGDDTRPTSKKELAGWYSYGWAAEVFTVCAMGMHKSGIGPSLAFIRS
jgi:UMF1 family MFS transporter